MATEAIHHPVENLELLRRLAEPLGYSSLNTWFEEIDSRLKPRPATALLPVSDTHPAYTIRRTGGYFRDCLSVGFVESESPQEKVTVRARKKYMGIGVRDEELDLLGTGELAWKRGIGSSFNLVAKGAHYKSPHYEPSIATVESAQLLTPHDAEISLQKIALLIVDTPIDLKVA